MSFLKHILDKHGFIKASMRDLFCYFLANVKETHGTCISIKAPRVCSIMKEKGFHILTKATWGWQYDMSAYFVFTKAMFLHIIPAFVFNLLAIQTCCFAHIDMTSILNSNNFLVTCSWHSVSIYLWYSPHAWLGFNER